ncbi:MAG: LemA family protein [Eubacteriales bacterium]|nr:LemA family protein [Eubacteriales bacterium]
MIPGIIVFVVVVLLVVFVVSGYNKLVRGKITIDEAFATMDVYLKKRFDLIPNLVETVKGYAKHEEGTLAEMVQLRSQNYNSMTEEEKLASGAAISQMVPKIMALAEAYPDLKANQNFLDLSKQLSQIEDDIANARKYYNGAVKQYNYSVQMFPNSLIAGIFHFETKKMYEVENDAERQNVQVKF